MSRFVYAPEGADPKRWDFDPMKLMSVEVEAIEDKTGMPFRVWAEALGDMSFKAIHGLLYVYLKREIPTLKWDDVQFSAADIDFEVDDEDAAPVVEDDEAPKA